MSTGLKRLNDPVAANTAASIGNIMSPLVHIPFKRQNDEVALSGAQTFTRASTATYIDPLDGLVKTAVIDAPRFERMSDGGTGILVEGTSTNLLVNSTSLDTVSWYTSNSTDVNPPNMVMSPDGTLNARSVSWSAGNGNRYISQNITGVQNTIYTLSVWVRSSVNTIGSLWLQDTVGYLQIIGILGFVATPTWTRIEISGDWGTSPTSARAIIETTLGAASTIEFYGVQLESLPFASSYIPTVNTAVTRAADNLMIPTSGNVSNESDSVVIEYDILGLMPRNNATVSWNVIQTLFDETVANQFGLEIYGFGDQYGLRTSTYDKSGSNPALVPIPNKTIKTCMIISPIGTKLYLDSVLVKENTFKFTTSSLQLGNLIIGSTNGGYLWGHIRNFRIYDKVLTAAEIALA